MTPSKFLSNHTPGPWFAKVRNDFIDVYAGEDSQTAICALGLAPAPDWPQQEADETNANACLIAAAPELLDAAKQAHEQMLHLYGKVGLTNLLRDVIAKAEGRS